MHRRLSFKLYTTIGDGVRYCSHMYCFQTCFMIMSQLEEIQMSGQTLYYVSICSLQPTPVISPRPKNTQLQSSSWMAGRTSRGKEGVFSRSASPTLKNPTRCNQAVAAVTSTVASPLNVRPTASLFSVNGALPKTVVLGLGFCTTWLSETANPHQSNSHHPRLRNHVLCPSKL